MTKTDWNKAVRAMRDKGCAKLKSGSQLLYRGQGCYSLVGADGNTVVCTYNLEEIKEICVD
ncbi:hypothetical protein [uncultured Allofournierella sp.]|uniref:hypothetical protein n=1 Tax=uncultured Allofournierella sp. TaxID=1940258 RepID=UPI003751C6DD